MKRAYKGAELVGPSERSGVSKNHGAMMGPSSTSTTTTTKTTDGSSGTNHGAKPLPRRWHRCGGLEKKTCRHCGFGLTNVVVEQTKQRQDDLMLSDLLIIPYPVGVVVIVVIVVVVVVVI
eukprot:scaffold160_cov139-Amphora_coffeaeformis.AAC.9